MDDGSLYSFITKSWSGKLSLSHLAETIVQKRSSFPGARPIISLDVGRTKTARFGYIPSPKFTIRGWVDVDGQPLRAQPVADGGENLWEGLEHE